MKKNLYFIFLLLVTITFVSACGSKKEIKKPEKPDIPDVTLTNDFDINIIKLTSREKNYLVSPYSIKVALNMLKEGANNSTKKQIEDVLPNNLNGDFAVKDRVKIANAVFIKDSYKNNIKKSFSNNLVKNYSADVLYDKFKKPDVINNWVNEKTDGMIKKLLDYMDENFVLGLANAIAIDVNWESPFECVNTRKNTFTKADKTEINVEMMHNTFDYSSYSYLKSSDAVGVIMPYESYSKKTGKVDYEKGESLEFIGILPNEDVNSYINNLTKEKLDELLSSGRNASNSFEINVSIPRFKYGYEVPNFIEILEKMGIKDAFSSKDADFTNIMKKSDMKDNLYVNQAIHKTYIDLNEKGTKAAAVTYFGFKNTAIPLEEEREVVNISFNRPFIYMIRDSKSKEVLFFGSVFEPNEWSGSTCKDK